jgi:polyisoprenoid-binding protein YceI
VLAALVLVGSVAAQGTRFIVDAPQSQLMFKATSRFVDADGRFHRFEGEVVVDPRDPSGGRVRLRVDAASIDTSNARRDAHLRSEDFFHVERHPDLVFESTGVEGRLPRLLVSGRLSARGVTREVRLPVEVEIAGATLTVRGQLDIRRTDYGISYQSLLNPLGDVVRVAFMIRARAVRDGS